MTWNTYAASLVDRCPAGWKLPRAQHWQQMCLQGDQVHTASWLQSTIGFGIWIYGTWSILVFDDRFIHGKLWNIYRVARQHIQKYRTSHIYIYIYIYIYIIEWYYVWWPWLTSKRVRVAPFCQHQLNFFLLLHQLPQQLRASCSCIESRDEAEPRYVSSAGNADADASTELDQIF